MKKQLLFCVCLMLISELIIAQTSPLVLVSQQGEVSYKGESKKSLSVTAGALLSINGHLKLKKNATAVLLCNEGFNALTDGTVNLQKVCGGTTSIGSLGIDGIFSKNILSSIEITYMAKDQSQAWGNIKDSKNMAGDGWIVGEKGGWGVGEKGGWGVGEKGGWGVGEKGGWVVGEKGGWGVGEKGGWGVGEKGGWGVGEKGGWGVGEKGGWGGKSNKINLIMPVGKISPKQIRFSWSQPANSTGYQVIIKDAGGNQIDSMEVKDTFAIIDLSKMKLESGLRYFWSVSSIGSNTIISNEEQFELVSGDIKKIIQPKLSKSKIYYKLDPTAKLLMEATAYENENMFYQAYEIYMKARKQDPKNNLAKMMHASFWLKAGLPPMAEMAIN